MYFAAVLFFYFADYEQRMYMAVKARVLSKQAAYIYICAYILWWIIRNILNI